MKPGKCLLISSWNVIKFIVSTLCCQAKWQMTNKLYYTELALWLTVKLTQRSRSVFISNISMHMHSTALYAYQWVLFASWLREDEDGASTQCALLLRFLGPNLSAGTSSTSTSTTRVSCSTYQHLAVEEHLLQTKETRRTLSQCKDSANSLKAVLTA